MKQPHTFGRSIRTLCATAGAIGLAGLLSACSPEKPETVEEIRPVKVVRLAPTSETVTLAYSGSVKPRTEMNMGFRINGKIVERNVDIGARVHKGDVLMRLDGVDLQLAVSRARASLDAARQQFDTANAAYRRADQLYARHTIPMAVLEQRKLAYDQALAGQTSAKSSLDEVRNQLFYADLKADRDGVVTTINADRGQVIGAGNVAIVIAADDEKEVQIAVPETEITQFSTGQKVRVRFWADAALDLDGKVREIAASADPLSRTFAIRISLNPDPRVLLGMTATIEAARNGATPDMVVPLSALSRQDGRTVAWVVDPETEKVTAHPVTTGNFAADGVKIASGLAEGDLVVIAGTQFMTDQRKVRLPDGLKDTLAAAGTQKPSS